MTGTMHNWRDPERWFKVVTLVGGLTAFLIGLREYRTEQRWKRLEYFTQLLSSVEAEPEVRGALLMLEYREPRICADDADAEAPRCFTATDSLLLAALDGSMRNRTLSPEEYRVVYSVDRLLTALERVEYLQEEGFVAEEVRHPSIAWWIALIGDQRNREKSPAVRARLCEYVRFFGYDGTQRLIDRYIPPRDRVPQCTATVSR